MSNLEGAINDELSHYYERAWEAIIYPMKYTQILNYSHSFTNLVFNLFIIYLKYKKDKLRYHMNHGNINNIYWNFIYFFMLIVIYF